MNATRKANGILALSSLLIVAGLLPAAPEPPEYAESTDYLSGTATAKPVIDVRIEVIKDSRALGPSSTRSSKRDLQANPSPMFSFTEGKPETKKTTSISGRSVRGSASWYCKAGVSICHHSYPPGSMVAAACGKLRRAIGSAWRGKVVTVSSGQRTVTVKLVDWCGSTSKLIDLYWEPMRRLGGTGVLPVTVRW